MDASRRPAAWNLLEWLCRLVLAAVFLFAAWPKLLDPAAFAKAIDNYRVTFPLIGKGYENLVAGFLPALEFVTAFGLLWNRTKRAATLLVMIMLVMFIILISQAVLRGLNIDCGCFGSGATSKLMARHVGLTAILEDVVWLALAVFVYIRTPRRS
jgi:uncharacterized membrane protein YphA (DoxX/SURF4 family)